MSKSRQRRLAEAKEWYKKQEFDENSHIVKAYRKKFGVDKTCAMRELCMLGVLSAEKQQAYLNHLKAKKQKRAKKKNNNLLRDIGFEQDEYFYYIAGYTQGGAPSGITWEEARLEGLIEDTGDMI